MASGLAQDTWRERLGRICLVNQRAQLIEFREPGELVAHLAADGEAHQVPERMFAELTQCTLVAVPLDQHLGMAKHGVADRTERRQLRERLAYRTLRRVR